MSENDVGKISGEKIDALEKTWVAYQHARQEIEAVNPGLMTSHDEACRAWEHAWRAANETETLDWMKWKWSPGR